MFHSSAASMAPSPQKNTLSKMFKSQVSNAHVYVLSSIGSKGLWPQTSFKLQQYVIQEML